MTGVQTCALPICTPLLTTLGIAAYNNTLSFNIESDQLTTVYYDQIQFLSTSTAHTEPNQFIGQDYDKESDLNYLNARYYKSSQGEFLSEDPVFWSTNQNLSDPQSFNIVKDDTLTELRTAVNKGRPFGNKEWAYKMIDEYDLGHAVRGVGRPKAN